jgi:hypothetical protein
LTLAVADRTVEEHMRRSLDGHPEWRNVFISTEA